MKFRFVGEYTGGRDSITMRRGDDYSVTFHGNEPTEVDDEDTIRRLSSNPDFKAVGAGGRPAKTEETNTEAENPPAEREKLTVAGKDNTKKAAK